MEPDETPVAWYYEMARGISSDGIYSLWAQYLSFTKPNVEPEGIRNLTPLYSKEPITKEPKPDAPDKAD